jgi:hypothetical protein
MGCFQNLISELEHACSTGKIPCQHAAPFPDELLNALKSNGSVRKLIVADGDVAKSSLRQIAKLVAVNTSLTYLHVRDINEDDEWILNHGNLAPFC